MRLLFELRRAGKLRVTAKAIKGGTPLMVIA